MTIALDLGASSFRSLRIANRRLAARRSRTTYSVFGDTAARRGMLDQLRMPYALCEDSIAIPGDGARDLADLFRAPIVSMLPNGRLAEGDPPARQMLAALVDAIVPEPEHPGELCGVVLPGPAGARDEQDSETARFLCHLLRLRGFSPCMITPATALVLAELTGEGLTGLGMTFGAASSHFSLVNRGQEVASGCLPKGGTWIDEQLASSAEQFVWDATGNCYLDADAMCRWKESNTQPIDEPADGGRQKLLVDAYRQWMTEAVAAAGEMLNDTIRIPESWPAMTVVIHGGGTRMPGFLPLFAQVLREARWPIRIKKVRAADDSEFTVARGCLIHAELEVNSATGKQAA